MKRIDFRVILGVLLILGGLILLFEKMGFLTNASGLFWGLVFGVAGCVFLYIFANDRASWWAAFPAFTLLGLSASSFLPPVLDKFGGLVFLGGIGLGFWVVYFTDRERWWAIIPGGVLVTLGVVSTLDELLSIDTGGIFFLGLGITFLLVALLPGPARMTWAYIPAGVLIVMGLLTGMPFFGLGDYLLPAVLIIGGLILVYLYFRRR